MQIPFFFSATNAAIATTARVWLWLRRSHGARPFHPWSPALSRSLSACLPASHSPLHTCQSQQTWDRGVSSTYPKHPVPCVRQPPAFVLEQVANFLCNGNYAVSGSSKACDVVEQIAKPDFKARMTVRLAVAGAFHTDFMEAAVDKV